MHWVGQKPKYSAVWANESRELRSVRKVTLTGFCPTESTHFLLVHFSSPVRTDGTNNHKHIFFDDNNFIEYQSRTKIQYRLGKKLDLVEKVTAGFDLVNI